MAKEKPTFEQSMARIEQIVAAIEQGQIGLEDSIARYSEGMELIARCRQILADAEMKVQTLQADAAGQLQVQPGTVPPDQPAGE